MEKKKKIMRSAGFTLCGTMPGTADRFGAAGHIGFCLRRCSLSGGDANHHPNPWKNYDLVPIGLLALLALLGYLGGTWLNTASTMLSHRSAFMILKIFVQS